MIFLLSCAGNADKQERSRLTIETYKQLYDNYAYMYRQLPNETTKKYYFLFDSFQELVKSGILREYEYAEVKQYEDFLKFLEENAGKYAQTSQTGDSK